ncbi:hypothetical protein OHB33_40715 (plasmid) [Streptomyces sp. NBC_01558]|uniref:hypothetical protein n=1 Tax=Streptomyces sp. NBC_01558 TaxID=2975878 RepID=UPI002DD8DF47|nr:hypothetical protein [Streptomyces sp. NBC_01558]WSD82713.1 hypothetical protein OHB33_40715 [Streptomyces sp. NBC_01558]
MRRVYEGRWVVSRAWIIQHTGAAASTVLRWYTDRDRYPHHLRHPDVACTVQRRNYFDQQAVQAFWAAWQRDIGTAHLGKGQRPGDGQGTRGGGPGHEQRDRAVRVVLEVLRREGAPRRGLAAELAREHGGVARSWRRAVEEALTVFENEQQREGQGRGDHGAP